jgi:zinc transport system substrate-binding protein
MFKTLFLVTIFINFAYAKVNVVVSIAPQLFFVKKIGGDLVDTTLMIPSGTNPVTYSPKPNQLNKLKKATHYFTISVAFEKAWMQKFLQINPNIIIVDSTSLIKKLPMNSGLKEDKEHKHTSLDPHVWLDPKLVKLQAKVYTDTLKKFDTANSNIYEKNYQNFLKELEKIDANITEKLKNLKNREFIVFHPSFGYFANSYGLKQIAIENEGKKPSLKYLNKVINFAKEHNIKTVFVAPQFSQKSAKYIANRLDADVKIIDPLSREWDKNILEIARSFEKANSSQ